MIINIIDGNSTKTATSNWESEDYFIKDVASSLILSNYYSINYFVEVLPLFDDDLLVNSEASWVHSVLDNHC